MNKTNRTEFIRVEKTKNYTVIHNQFLRRSDLSWKAKGILAYVLSLPDDWNINLKELMRHATDGEASFRSGWKELTDKRYVIRKAVRDGQRISHWETIVYESVDTKESSLLPDFQDVENLDVENLDVDNRNLLSTNELSTNKQSTNKQSTEQNRVPFAEIINYLNEKADKNFKNVESNNKHIRARWNEGYRLDDFKQVIDTKVSEWKGITFSNGKSGDTYLKPSTLFGNKFDEYMNQSSLTAAPKKKIDSTWEEHMKGLME